jgi:hypothetical protein
VWTEKKLSAISFQLSAISFQRSAGGSRLGEVAEDGLVDMLAQSRQVDEN